jgi:hypothetical protein
MKDSKRHPNRRVYEHINAIGWDKVRIVLIENYPCENKRALIMRENYWYQELGPVLNNNVPGRRPICRHNRRLQFCVACNGSGCCKHGKSKYYCKKCSGDRVEKIHCDCGAHVTKNNMKRHIKTSKKHLVYQKILDFVLS